jgi:hypothetical protein
MNNKRWILLITLVLILGSLTAGTIWLNSPRPALPDALNALESDELVEVSLDPWITFSPNGTPTTGFIFYPGGRVDPRAYSVILRGIASAGHLVILPEMPLDLAVLDVDIADQIIDTFPEIDTWVIGGHSLGGSMASQYASDHPDRINGLVLWGSYPVDNSNLVAENMPVLLIYGSLDTGSNDPVIEEKKILLPESTTYIRIEGGNHHQFGDYQDDSKDPLPTISRADQQKIILEGTLDFLKKLSQ